MRVVARPAVCFAAAALLAWSACQPSSSAKDAGRSCDASHECGEAVCRRGACVQAACQDDVECGLGERCRDGGCRFEGCTADDQCASGLCDEAHFSCAECQKDADCPEGRPRCLPSQTCAQCQSDSDCAEGGPAHCDVASGACVHCTEDAHCPQGLRCGGEKRCRGQPLGAPCAVAQACDVGLSCVNAGTGNRCMQACSLYGADCPPGEICFQLSFSGSSALVFDRGGPVGVCAPPLAGFKVEGQACDANQLCQPNLACVPQSASEAVCRPFCDPTAPSCVPGEPCHAFPGDFSGHQYGLCYPDNGYGAPCTGDAQCGAALGCGPRLDPSAIEGLSNACLFSPGAKKGLAPCATEGADGGRVANGDVCRSGICAGDTAFTGEPFFCFAACETDLDCALTAQPGRCEGAFFFLAGTRVAELKGCRPVCRAPDGCAAYGARFTCGGAVEVPTVGPERWTQGCTPMPPDAGAGVGEACGADSECLSGRCDRRDGRGVAREGRCVHPCFDASDCLTRDGRDGGAPVDAGVACRDVVQILSAGADQLAGTLDDRRAIISACVGEACDEAADCASGTHCVPLPDPMHPDMQFVLACRPKSASGALVAGAVCQTDAECESGACARSLLSPGTRRCFTPCGQAQVCPHGGTCAPQAFAFTSPDGTLHAFDGCE